MYYISWLVLALILLGPGKKSFKNSCVIDKPPTLCSQVRDFSTCHAIGASSSDTLRNSDATNFSISSEPATEGSSAHVGEDLALQFSSALAVLPMLGAFGIVVLDTFMIVFTFKQMAIII